MHNRQSCASWVLYSYFLPRKVYYIKCMKILFVVIFPSIGKQFWFLCTVRELRSDQINFYFDLTLNRIFMQTWRLSISLIWNICVLIKENFAKFAQNKEEVYCMALWQPFSLPKFAFLNEALRLPIYVGSLQT